MVTTKVQRTYPMGTRCMWKGPILLWTHCIYTKDKTYGDAMLVKRTNPIEILPIYEGPIKWVHDACTKDQSYWYMMHVQWSYPNACKKDKFYGYVMHVERTNPIGYTMHVVREKPMGTKCL